MRVAQKQGKYPAPAIYIADPPFGLIFPTMEVPGQFTQIVPNFTVSDT